MVNHAFCCCTENLSEKLLTSSFYLGANRQFVLLLNLHRSSHQRCSVKKGILRNFVKFTGKCLWRSLFLSKKDTLAQLHSWEFCEISKKNFSIEHLRTTASVFNNQGHFIHILLTLFQCRIISWFTDIRIRGVISPWGLVFEITSFWRCSVDGFLVLLLF